MIRRTASKTVFAYCPEFGIIAIDTGVTFLRIVSPFYFLISIKLVADGVLRGAGLMGRFMASTFTDLILRVVLAFVFSALWGATGIWCAWPIGWALGTILSVVFYHNGPWKKEAGLSTKE